MGEQAKIALKQIRENKAKGHVPRHLNETDAQYQARKAQILALERKPANR
jgi:hypothetical protein